MPSHYQPLDCKYFTSLFFSFLRLFKGLPSLEVVPSSQVLNDMKLNAEDCEDTTLEF